MTLPSSGSNKVRFEPELLEEEEFESARGVCGEACAPAAEDRNIRKMKTSTTALSYQRLMLLPIFRTKSIQICHPEQSEGSAVFVFPTYR